MSTLYYPCPNNVMDSLAVGPFQQLNNLLHNIPLPSCVHNMHIGEPQLGLPSFAKAKQLALSHEGWSQYPKATGTEIFCQTINNWLTRRYNIAPTLVPHHSIIPLTGTREGLYQLISYAIEEKKPYCKERPIIICANPFYHVYKAASFLHGADMVMVDIQAMVASNSTIIDYISAFYPNIWHRVAAIIINNPDNPTGYMYDKPTLDAVYKHAMHHGFFVIADECYSEIYEQDAPIGMVEIAQNHNNLCHIMVVNSLSKRSGGAGLRSGFAVIDPYHVERVIAMRNHISAISQTPLLDIACMLWNDEQHVIDNRNHYRQLAAIAREACHDVPHFTTPSGGFFLWLDVGNGEECARLLYRKYGVKTLPGRYMSLSDEATSSSPGDNYIRLAMVASPHEFKESIEKVAFFLHKR